jgi:pSer/pThr/pTyr-binding forkhead associated (FHA) protein
VSGTIRGEQRRIGQIVKHLGLRDRTRPDPSAPGTLGVVADGDETAQVVQPGETVVVGRDPASGVVLDDQTVSPSHASIRRFGPGWLVSSLDGANPAFLLDDTGRAQPVGTELGLRSGELLVGRYQVRLYPPERILR